MKRRTAFVLSGISLAVATCFTGVFRFLQQPKFGAVPNSFESFKNCSHFYDGIFHNTLPTPVLTDNSTFIEAFARSLVTDKIDPAPSTALPSAKVDLKQLRLDIDTIIWLGHSSFYIQLAGKRILIDPVLSPYASPVSFSTKAFEGTSPYRPEDFPSIDLLMISHDHWDHLDYPTVMALKGKIHHIVCPLGTDSHFLRWGFKKETLHALDWNETLKLSNNLVIHALEARHYSGRNLNQNKSFWASYLLQSKDYKIFFSGDSGYSPHFKEIGYRFAPIDLALLDSGQYNDRWRYIHLNPNEALQAAQDLKALNFLPAHIGKFSLSMHPWYEPFVWLTQKATQANVRLITPEIGQPLQLSKRIPAQTQWWTVAMQKQKNEQSEKFHSKT